MTMVRGDHIVVLERLRRLTEKYHIGNVRIDLDWQDDGLWSDEVFLWCGDSNCWHQHRYNPETGHGWTEVSTEWEDDDGPELASLNRALDELERIMAEPIDCEHCEKEKAKGA